MKAIRFMEPYKIEVSEVAKPVPGPNDILVKIMAVGVCATDLELLSGEMPHIKNGFTKFPLIPGHEWTGVIEAVGEFVKGFTVGERVTGDVSIGCGCCQTCREGHYNLCPNRVVIGSYRNKDGAFAEYLTIPYRHVYKLPDNIGFEDGALIEPAATAYYGVKRANVKFGDTVAVIGDGPIGLLAVQCAKLSGASKVISVGSWDEKLEIAKQTGADVVYNYKRNDVVEVIRNETGGVGVDKIIETSGNNIAFNQAIQAIRPQGRIALLSFYSGTEMPAIINTVITKDAELCGVLASPNCFKPIISMISSGKLNVKPLITHRFPLEKFEDVVKLMEEKKECRIKILLIP